MILDVKPHDLQGHPSIELTEHPASLGPIIHRRRSSMMISIQPNFVSMIHDHERYLARSVQRRAVGIGRSASSRTDTRASEAEKSHRHQVDVDGCGPQSTWIRRPNELAIARTPVDMGNAPRSGPRSSSQQKVMVVSLSIRAEHSRDLGNLVAPMGRQLGRANGSTYRHRVANCHEMCSPEVGLIARQATRRLAWTIRCIRGQGRLTRFVAITHY